MNELIYLLKLTKRVNHKLIETIYEYEFSHTVI
jgi:hypothetical protein